MNISLKNLFNSVFCIVFIFSVFFYITEYSTYRAAPPRMIGSFVEPFREEGVWIQAKAYDAHDSRAYLSHDLNSAGFRPVQVSIQNNTKNTYLLSEKGVDIPNASSGNVSGHLTARGIPKSIAYKVAGLLFWPFLIPATIDTILTVKSHIGMRADFHAKSIKQEGEAILPYSTVHRILFVPKDQYSDAFTLRLKDPKNGHFYGYPVIINS